MTPWFASSHSFPIQKQEKDKQTIIKSKSWLEIQNFSFNISQDDWEKWNITDFLTRFDRNASKCPHHISWLLTVQNYFLNRQKKKIRKKGEKKKIKGEKEIQNKMCKSQMPPIHVMANSKDGQVHKDKCLSTSIKILSQKCSVQCKSSNIFYFVMNDV